MATKSTALPERPPLNILAAQADVDALFKQGAESHVLCQGPVHRPVLHHLPTGFQNTAQTCRDRSQFIASAEGSSNDTVFVPQPAHRLTDCKCLGTGKQIRLCPRDEPGTGNQDCREGSALKKNYSSVHFP